MAHTVEDKIFELADKHTIGCDDNMYKRNKEMLLEFAHSLNIDISDSIYYLREKDDLVKDAIDARVITIGQNAIVKEENEDELCKYLLSKFQDGDKVKVIIIKE